MRPLYVSRAGGTKLLNAIFLAVPIGMLLFAMEAASTSAPGALGLWIGVVVMLLILGSVRAILPDAFEVYEDHIRLVFPFSGWNIPFSSIEGVQAARWWQPYAAMGIRFATAPGQAVTIQRRGMSLLGGTLVISPHDRAEFLAAFQPILDRYRSSHPSR